MSRPALERGAEFVFPGRTRLREIADFYALNVPADRLDTTLAEHIVGILSGDPVTGDRIEEDGYALVVRKVSENLIDRVGLEFGDQLPGLPPGPAPGSPGQ